MPKKQLVLLLTFFVALLLLLLLVYLYSGKKQVTGTPTAGEKLRDFYSETVKSGSSFFGK